MIRPFGLCCVSLALLLQLTWLPLRSLAEPWRAIDPWSGNLPIAGNSTRTHCDSCPTMVVNLTKSRNWTLENDDLLSDEKLERELESWAKRTSTYGLPPALYVRIPSDAPARHFISLTHIAERCGIERLRLAVLSRKPFPASR